MAVGAAVIVVGIETVSFNFENGNRDGPPLASSSNGDGVAAGKDMRLFVRPMLDILRAWVRVAPPLSNPF